MAREGILSDRKDEAMQSSAETGHSKGCLRTLTAAGREQPNRQSTRLRSYNPRCCPHLMLCCFRACVRSVSGAKPGRPAQARIGGGCLGPPRPLSSFGGHSGDGVVSQGSISQYNFFDNIGRHPLYPSRQEEVNAALMEAWS